jgi:aspartyl-tRNA(Asn)/glutamyl-tRNA(Gln) amidotransferase subunit B
MRGKEAAHDYRYFPEPDLPPNELTAERLAAIRAVMPELPAARRTRLAAEYDISAHDAAELTRSRELADYFEQAARAAGNAKAAANWIMGELSRTLNERGGSIAHAGVTPDALAGLITLVDRGTINTTTAKSVFEKMYATGQTADAIVRAEGLAQVSDEQALAGIVSGVLAAHTDAIAQYRAGKAASLGFLVGQVMKATGGQANPRLVNELLRREIERA